MSNPLISIVVCTFNRSDLLAICLESLAKQTSQEEDFEVIIVDNNSSDDTSEVSSKYTNNYGNFKYFSEEEIGLSSARNRGLKEAKGKYVGYIDDDAKASQNLVEKSLEIINKYNPDIFGGPIYPYYLNQKPAWFKDEYGNYSVHKESGFIAKGTYLSGSNIFFRKNLLEEMGGFNTDLGMKGKELGYHEETVIQNEAHERNKQVYYSLDLVVYHIVSEVKQNILNSIYSNYKSGKDGIKVWKDNRKVKEIFSLLRKVDNLMVEFNNAIANQDKTKYPFPENYVYEKLSSQIFDIGFKTAQFLDEEKIENVAFLEYLILERKIELDELLKIYDTYTDKVDFHNLLGYYSKLNRFSLNDVKEFINLANKNGYNLVHLSSNQGIKETIRNIFRVIRSNKYLHKILHRIKRG